MKKVTKVILWTGVAVEIIVLLNMVFWVMINFNFQPVENMFWEGRVFTIGNRAYVFAHGNYQKEGNDNYHFTYLNGSKLHTLALIEDLKEEGYDYIWLSQCHTGDHEYIELKNNTALFWSDYPEVSRNKVPGKTLPIFIGLGFVRVSLS